MAKCSKHQDVCAAYLSVLSNLNKHAGILQQASLHYVLWHFEAKGKRKILIRILWVKERYKLSIKYSDNINDIFCDHQINWNIKEQEYFV